MTAAELVEAIRHSLDLLDAARADEARAVLLGALAPTERGGRDDASCAGDGVVTMERRTRARFGWESLTPTERSVVALLTEGLTNSQIAERLYVSRATVKTHVAHVYAKLGMSSRVEVATAALRRLHGAATLRLAG